MIDLLSPNAVLLLPPGLCVWSIWNIHLILQEIDIKNMVKRYYEKLYDSKLDNLYEMNTFLDNHILPKLTQKERENVNSSIFI